MTAVVTRRPPPDDAYGQVNPVWKGKTVVILGGGPSLTKAQIERCRGLPCIAVNDQYLNAPWADVLYFADWKWHAWHRNRQEFKDFAGIKVSIDVGVNQMHNAAIFMRNGGGSLISTNPHEIRTGSNGVYQALNIATLAQAARVLLLGVDGKRAADGRTHNFGDHPDKSEPPYQVIRGHFREAADAIRSAGVTEVINCSPGTAIDHFTCMPLEDALRDAPGVVADSHAAVVSG